MKVALCFFGQPRDVIGCYTNIVKNIIIPNSIEDIFVHVWWRPEFETTGYFVNTDNSGRRSYMTKSFLNFISDNYKPKKIIIENDLLIKFHSPDTISKSCNISAPLNRLFPMFYSRQASCDIKNQYKKEVGIEKYDGIIVIRFDDYVKREIKLENFDLKIINVPVLWRRNIIDINYVSDIITFGNEMVIDKYSQVYNSMPLISSRVDNFFSERLIGEWLKINEIKFTESLRYPEDIVMYRDK